MGSVRLTLCTGLLAVAALTPVAYAADDGPGVTVTPAAPAPGGDVSLRVRGCTGAQGTAASAAFVSDARLTGSQGTLAGETRIRTSLEPGGYEVRISCSGTVVTGRITVVETSSGRDGLPSDALASPVAPVHAGGGGTAHFATVATSGSAPGTGQAVTGLALAGVAAAAVGLLRARRSRGTD
ncbi:hypothetical protein [Streptomyces diastatochromogenes]|uniref:Sortase n=1 Tax=Streptomyces diastatochromogenes TaxID=42236 RepID=A0A233SX26_STRDA|nr:hypothetical protein [Streptomyces diastatochromogenes]OXZ00194.1 hypothetical protein BEK98_01375 [Streptomyces diastatochromogenes]